ncbi:S24 family peptidase [Sodalis sp. C49]|uniref:S24 family peptidase n=1 Tax=Sodalis sp. C49 TaxID=3228929 RepID=UPI003965C4D2
MVEKLDKYRDFAERLNLLMQQSKVDISTLKTISGVSYEMARRYTLGTAKPRDEKMIKIADHFEVSPAYLDYGYGEPTLSNTAKDSERIEQIEAYASAGNGYINRDFPEIIRSIEIPKERIYELFGRKSLNGVYIMNVDGDSMMPTLNPRDLLFIDTSVDHFTGDGIYVFSFEESTFVKRLQRVKGRKLSVLSDNEKYPPFSIEENEMHELNFFGKLIKQLPLQFHDFA